MGNPKDSKEDTPTLFEIFKTTSKVGIEFHYDHSKEMEEKMKELLDVMMESKDELSLTGRESCHPHAYLIKPINLMEEILKHQRLRVSLLKKLRH